MARIKIIDSSRYSRVELGSTFTRYKHQTCYRPLLDDLGSDNVQLSHKSTLSEILEVELVSANNNAGRWSLACGIDSQLVGASYATLVHADSQTRCSLKLDDDFKLSVMPENVKAMLPDSLFGLLLGCSAGMILATGYMRAAAQRIPEMMADLHVWRAPRFAFSLRTATGSPFSEQWSFAIQERARNNDEKFRLLVEQQRTGKEFLLMRNMDGSFEGLTAVEELPSSIHGTAIGVVAGMAEACRLYEWEKTEASVAKRHPVPA